jgi:hypothetical protein
MKYKTLYIAWGCMYLLCAALGLVQNPDDALKTVMFFASVAFFLPPAVILYRSIPREEYIHAKLIRGIAIFVLVATVVVFCTTVFAYAAGEPELTGQVLHTLLVLVSNPMICGVVWVVPLFLWAVLMFICIRYTKKKK